MGSFEDVKRLMEEAVGAWDNSELAGGISRAGRRAGVRW